MGVIEPSRLVLAIVALVAGSAAAHTTQRVSVSSSGEQGNNFSFDGAISADGRFVAFASHASTLVGGDTNVKSDVFVRDLQAGATVRVSVSSSGEQAENDSDQPVISGDGRLVAFRSFSSTLVPGDSNLQPDVFVHDRETGLTARVSVSFGGAQAEGASGEPSISRDGRFVAFSSDAVNLDNSGQGGVFVHELATGATTKASLTNLGSSTTGTQPFISADGRFVAFASAADNIDFGDPNEDLDVYVRDRLFGLTTWVSAGPPQGFDSDSGAPSISDDGRYVAFVSDANNLVPGGPDAANVYLYDMEMGTLAVVSVGAAGAPADDPCGSAHISGDGRFVAFSSSDTDLVPGSAGFPPTSTCATSMQE